MHIVIISLQINHINMVLLYSYLSLTPNLRTLVICQNSSPWTRIKHPCNMEGMTNVRKNQTSSSLQPLACEHSRYPCRNLRQEREHYIVISCQSKNLLMHVKFYWSWTFFHHKTNTLYTNALLPFPSYIHTK